MKNLLYWLVLMAFISCKDPQTLHIYTSNESKYTVYLKDDYSESPTVIAPEATLYLYSASLSNNSYNSVTNDILSNTPIAENYLYKTQADKQGIFHFDYQPTNLDNVLVVGEYTDKNSLLFRQKKALSGLNNDPVLYLSPIYSKGTLKTKTVDQNNRIINGMNVYIFVNEGQAKAAQTSDPKGFIQTAASNALGIAFFSNLEDPKGNSTLYYVVGKKDTDYTDVATIKITNTTPTYSPAKQVFTTINTTSIPSSNVTITDPLVLSLVSKPLGPVQLSVLVNSTQGGVLYGADVYLFLSLEQAALATVDDDHLKDLKYVATAQTGVDGIAKFSNVPTGTYYVRARYKVVDSTDPSKTIVKAMPASVGNSPSIVITSTPPSSPLPLPF